MLGERTQFHHARLAGHITACSGYAWPTPLAPDDAVVQAQATMMSDLGIFRLLGVLVECFWPPAPLLPGMPTGASLVH